MSGINNVGKYLGMKDGYKIFKNFVREEGSKVYNTNKTYYTYVDDSNNSVKTIVRNIVSKSDIAKGKSVTPRSSWTTTNLNNGNQEILEYYPRAIRKSTYPTQELGSQQSLILSQDGKYVTNYTKETATYNAGITYGNQKQGSWDSRSRDLLTVNEPKCEWISLADYNQSHPYHKLK